MAAEDCHRSTSRVDHSRDVLGMEHDVMNELSARQVKTAIQLLKEARSTIAYPDQLTRFQAACDFIGRQVSPLHPAARRWCSTGAVIKAAGAEAGVQLDLALAALQQAIGGSIPEFHDRALRYEILAKFDEAIMLIERLDAPGIVPPHWTVLIEDRAARAAMRWPPPFTTA